ncbi:GMP synthase (glutamine-hydrolyzing) [Penicillium ucsense]|uniref:GMP synthase (Glutamine-hydrolyzing) n=1 Tax=Penicillium ucsense TaxID=2839758 RepID=A0A8J8W1B5_9EURO|nr:GMP synthase (glutamine-hydrolyzing) [Penicillium ucsense]KAF7735156.1 GMP synthase (glutamine-hydrolyzing) [Penicillium ucsense]
MTRSLRIAVLECDTPIAPVTERLGGYGEIFERLLLKGLAASPDSGVEFAEISKWHVVDNPVYPDPSKYDAFLLSGSKHDSFRDDPWIVSLTEYVRGLLEDHKKPVVGICFGHQIIARALGARVGRGDHGWEISVDEINLTETGQRIFGKDKLYLQQMHRDVVHEVPKGCVNLGSSPRCAIQGLYMPKRIWSVQAHPEFTEFIISQVLKARHQSGVFNDELFQDGFSRAGKAHDGEFLAAEIVKFIAEATS